MTPKIEEKVKKFHVWKGSLLRASPVSWTSFMEA
jgi:hypothetical protein